LTKIKIISKVENGRLLSNRKMLSAAIANYEGQRVEISIEKAKNKRTNPQNRWYWGVAIEIISNRLIELGSPMNKENIHVMLKLAVGKIEPSLIYNEIVIESTGEVLNDLKSTSELTTTEFMAFKQHIQQWSIETLDVNIPDPDEQQIITF
jgi:hypothetical protein